MRLRILACLLACLLAGTAARAQTPAAAEDNPLGMYVIETPDLKLIYLDPLGFTAPYAIRTFTNSLAWQRQRFGWKPSEPTTVLIKDFADYGGAAAWAAPRNTLFLDIAPLSHAFETYPAAERMYSLMNHELVHVASNDVANDVDRTWRRVLPRQGRAALRKSRVAAVRLPDRAALPRAALVARGQRGVHGHLDGRRPRVAPRAATTRWCSARWCATARRSSTRSASSRAACASTSRSAPTPTCTAPAS